MPLAQKYLYMMPRINQKYDEVQHWHSMHSTVQLKIPQRNLYIKWAWNDTHTHLRQFSAFSFKWLRGRNMQMDRLAVSFTLCIHFIYFIEISFYIFHRNNDNRDCAAQSEPIKKTYIVHTYWKKNFSLLFQMEPTSSPWCPRKPEAWYCGLQDRLY